MKVFYLLINKIMIFSYVNIPDTFPVMIPLIILNNLYIFLVFNIFYCLPAKVAPNPNARLTDRVFLLSEKTFCATDPQPNTIKMKIPNVSAKNALIMLLFTLRYRFMKS